MKNTTKTVFLLAFLCVFLRQIKANTFTSIATGNWNAGATWNQSGATPGSGDDVVIANTHNVTINVASSITNVTINAGGTLTSGAGITLDVAGNWSKSGTFTPSTGTVNFNSSTINQTITAETFYNLTINNTKANGTVTPSGTITLLAGGTLTMTAGALTMGTNSFVESGGAVNFTATGGTYRTSRVAGTPTLPEFTGTYNITGGTIWLSGIGNVTIRSLNASPACYYNLKISLAVTNATLGGNIEVKGDMTSGSALSSCRLSGHRSSKGSEENERNYEPVVPNSFSHGNFTVSITGSGNQTISLGGVTFYNLTVNKSAGVLSIVDGQSMSGGPVITNNLTMTSGLIDISQISCAYLNLGTSGAASTLTRSAGTWIYGQRPFARYWPANTAITSTSGNYYGLFPMGSSTAYRPVELNSTATPTTNGYMIVYIEEYTGQTDLSPYCDDNGTNIERINKTKFQVASVGPTDGTFNLNVTMTDLGADGTENDIRLARFAGGTTANVVGTHAAATGTPANPTAKRTGVDDADLVASDFRISTINKSVTPLPMELLYFNAYPENIQVVRTEWRTVTETNNDYFIIERNKTTADWQWEQIGTVKGAGNSTIVHNYVFYDEHPYIGVSYYRLRQVDFNGQSASSSVRQVYLGTFEIISTYPNPGSDYIHYTIVSEAGGSLSVKVMDVLGREVMSAVEEIAGGITTRKLNTSALSHGLYLLQITTENREKVQKQFLVQ